LGVLVLGGLANGAIHLPWFFFFLFSIFAFQKVRVLLLSPFQSHFISKDHHVILKRKKSEKK